MFLSVHETITVLALPPPIIIAHGLLPFLPCLVFSVVVLTSMLHSTSLSPLRIPTFLVQGVSNLKTYMLPSMPMVKYLVIWWLNGQRKRLNPKPRTEIIKLNKPWTPCSPFIMMAHAPSSCFPMRRDALPLQFVAPVAAPSSSPSSPSSSILTTAAVPSNRLIAVQIIGQVSECQWGLMASNLMSAHGCCAGKFASQSGFNFNPL